MQCIAMEWFIILIVDIFALQQMSEVTNTSLTSVRIVCMAVADTVYVYSILQWKKTDVLETAEMNDSASRRAP
jgi:hypothetical protein